MANERYRANVQALCDKRGIRNPIEEEDLRIERFVFWDAVGPKTRIIATHMNRGGRLFFEEHGVTSDGTIIIDLPLTDELRAQAAIYFAELWEERLEIGKRPLIDAVRDPKYVSVEIDWKDQ